MIIKLSTRPIGCKRSVGFSVGESPPTLVCSRFISRPRVADSSVRPGDFMTISSDSVIKGANVNLRCLKEHVHGNRVCYGNDLIN